VLFYHCKRCINYQLFACPPRSIPCILVSCLTIPCVIVVIKSNLPLFVKDRGVIDKPTRAKEIDRNRLFFAVEIKHPMLIRESVSER
jgi:hypothetical protein